MKSNSYTEYPYRYQHKTPKQSPNTESSKFEVQTVHIQTKNDLYVFTKVLYINLLESKLFTSMFSWLNGEERRLQEEGNQV